MLSQRYYITEPTNNEHWPMGDFTGHDFENWIYDLLVRELNTRLEETVTIELTPGSRDDGKDIVITSGIDLENIFNLNFFLRERPEIKIYFECKCSDEYNISYDSVLSKVSKVKNDNIQYYILVTNKTITAYTYYQLQEEFKQHNIEFYLVDQYLLYRIFSKYEASPIAVENLDLPEKLYAEYQVFTPQASKEYQIYILLRNYSAQNILFHLHLLSDWNWMSQPQEYKSVVEAWNYKIINVKVSQKYNDGIEDLKFHLNSNTTESTFRVKGVHASLNFEPSLCGKQHKEIITKFSADIIKKEFKGIRYLYGEAGTGKTRLVYEILNKISGKNVITKHISCNNDTQTKQNIYDFLYKHNLINEICLGKSLAKCLSSIKESERRFLIILDDIHNLNTLLDEIKKVDFHIIPDHVALLLIGRNDFSIGSMQYYNFIAYCRDISGMKGEILYCMDDDDTEVLIRSIIQDIPDIVLKRIKGASNNNPLYIIQFIEYLLELNLAHIINRETIGIYNVDNFSNHLYIPAKIEKLYQQRKNNLQNLPSGNLLQQLLFILSFLERPISIYTLKHTLHISDSDINLLLFRKFIKFVDYQEKQIWFYHESLFLYFKKCIRKQLNNFEQVLNSILTNDLLFDMLAEFQKGELFFYIGDYTKAKIFFEPITSFCKTIKNYTTCRTDLSFLPYLDLIFDMYSHINDVKLLKNCVIYKIYTILHYFTPVRAIEVCNDIEKKISVHPLLKGDIQLKNTINILKCHSYVNAGQLRNAENSYQKLISNYILSPETFANESAFDMFERLSGLYIRYNNYEVADHYNKISESFAKNMLDDNLMGLVEITRAKLNFYRNTETSYTHLLKAKDYLSQGGAQRNLLHNDITIAAYQIMYSHLNNKQFKEMNSVVSDFLKISIENQYPSLIIRSYLLLGIIDILTYEKQNRYQAALDFINKGIDASIQYGLPSYIWMLYNLKFIIAVNQKERIEYIEKLAETTYSLIKQQNLLSWGYRDFTYGNIPVITNVVRFYAEQKFESEFYRKVSQINYQNKSIFYDFYDFNEQNTISEYPDIEALNVEYRRVLEGKLLYMDEKVSYKIKDIHTGYFIVFA